MARNDPFRNSVLALAAAAAVVALLVAYAPPAGAASDRMPDLRMDQARNLQVQNAGGRKLLRFDSIVVNVGAGPFELLGKNRTGSTMTRVEQRVFDDAGGSRYVVSGSATTPATMVFGGDGHNHWHVKNLQ